MNTKTKSLRLKNKGDKTPRVVTLTDEQIMLIRSLYLRLEQMWLYSNVTVYLGKNGDVERAVLCECTYCKRGSTTGPGDIAHKENCIIPLADAEWEKMNAEFIRALSTEAAD